MPTPAVRTAPSARPAAPSVAPPTRAAAASPPDVAPVESAPSVDEAELTQRVLVDVQRQVELMLEVRLREALAPALGRATDALIRDARKELTAALRDIVSRAVTQELARRSAR